MRDKNSKHRIGAGRGRRSGNVASGFASTSTKHLTEILRRSISTKHHPQLPESSERQKQDSNDRIVDETSDGDRSKTS